MTQVDGVGTVKLNLLLAFSRRLKAPNPGIVELIEILRRRGFQLEIGIGAELLAEPSKLVVESDLYILKSHAALWLSVSGMVHGQHGRMLNPYQACLATHNKIIATWWLATAGIPIPTTWITGDLGLMSRLVAEQPLIIKPYIGGRGVGVRVAASPHDLLNIPPPEAPVIVQRYFPNCDELKVYVIGPEVFAVRKRSTPDGSTATPCSVSEDIRAIALRCGRVFGLGLYGLDVIESPDAPLVVDVNYFPSYRGVPNAAQLLADYIDRYAHGRCPELIADDGRAKVQAATRQRWQPHVYPGSHLRPASSTDVQLGQDMRFRRAPAIMPVKPSYGYYPTASANIDATLMDASNNGW